jgi:hypothetical protein
VNVAGSPSETSVFGLPETAVPPLSQVPDAIGPHTKKFTCPVGSPPAAVPVTTALSKIEPPRVIECVSVPLPSTGVVTVLDGIFATSKHSPGPSKSLASV